MVLVIWLNENVEYFVLPVVHSCGNVVEGFIIKLAYFGVPLLDALTSGFLIATAPPDRAYGNMCWQ